MADGLAYEEESEDCEGNVGAGSEKLLERKS